MIASVNPFNGVVEKTFEDASDRDIESRLDLAMKAYLAHRRPHFRTVHLSCSPPQTSWNRRRGGTANL